MRNTIFEGQEAPDFGLSDLDGKQIRLSDFRGKKIVVLTFLRGFM
jgi:peroxiredoxin